MSDQAAISKVNADGAAGGVLFKLIVFSLSLGLVPIASYFLSAKYVWDGNTTFAAITAIVAANVVLVAYIITAVMEDQKSAPPRSQIRQMETRKEK
ncbi:hypothetical protein B0H34DRAFT_689280 [Crassisporium funariophilum]|nr:hypothetical protein B0H34DRAFT_689280 [Crassisporium funariophilum]